MFGMVKGRNGKGVLIELMKKTLGKGYFKTLPLDYVTDLLIKPLPSFIFG